MYKRQAFFSRARWFDLLMGTDSVRKAILKGGMCIRDRTELGIKQIKEYFQLNLSSELRLRRVTAPLFVLKGMGINDDLNGIEPVSYTHLDVYKRQGYRPLPTYRNRALSETTDRRWF